MFYPTFLSFSKRFILVTQELSSCGAGFFLRLWSLNLVYYLFLYVVHSRVRKIPIMVAFSFMFAVDAQRLTPLWFVSTRIPKEVFPISIGQSITNLPNDCRVFCRFIFPRKPRSLWSFHWNANGQFVDGARKGNHLPHIRELLPLLLLPSENAYWMYH